MESTFALLGEDFAIMAADATSARSILVFKHDQDKIVELDSEKMIVGAGVAADSAKFIEFVARNMKIYELNNDVKLTTHATAHFVRGELAKALRKGPFQTNILLTGYDKSSGKFSLYYMDYLSALSKVNFGAHGYAANFILSVFDRDWRKGMNVEEAMVVVKKCLFELKTRFLISQPNFVIKIVDKDGIRLMTL